MPPPAGPTQSVQLRKTCFPFRVWNVMALHQWFQEMKSYQIKQFLIFVDFFFLVCFIVHRSNAQ